MQPSGSYPLYVEQHVFCRHDFFGTSDLQRSKTGLLVWPACQEAYADHNRPVISDQLKTKAARRDIPIPDCLAECLREAKTNSKSDFVVANRDGGPLSYTQFKRVWQYIVTRSTKERTYALKIRS